MTFEEAVARIGALTGREPRIVISGNSATPFTLVGALTQALETCRVFQLNAQYDFAGHAGFICETPFVGPGMRHDPMLDYLPMRLSLVPRLFDTVRRPDAVLLHTSLPREGKVSLGIEVNVLPAAVDQTRARGGLVLAQVNPHMPYTFGASEIPVESIDGLLEVDEPLTSPAWQGSEEAATAIGERVASFATDGTTLQLGIGAHSHRGGGDDVEPPRPASVVGDDQRRRHGPRSRRRAQSGCTDLHLLPDRLARALPLGGRERAAPHAADRDRQRPGAHRRAPLHALDQRGHAGRPLRPGQRQLRGRAYPLGIRRAARFRLRGPSLTRWARGRGRACLARQDGLVDRRSCPDESCDVVPTLGGDQ